MVPKQFEIQKETVSTTEWGNVDKSRIWRVLKEGLEEGAGGVREAIREVYAAVTATVDENLTMADVKLPHHEVRDNGNVVLNRAGLIAAAAALAGARGGPDLTPEQKRGAMQHLRRHYRQLEQVPPESLQESQGEMSYLEARIVGEMRPEDIPLATGVDLVTLKDGDEAPMEVVVEVPQGKSKRGWNYTGEALQSIVNHVNQHTLSGFLGHQKPEEVDTQFPQPVTHWIGAKWENGRAYFRGVVDKVAGDLKRWIKAKRVNQVSIFGVPEIEQSGGETRVVGYQPLSIDWTPHGRAGMPTRIIAVGEMDSTFAGGLGGYQIKTGGDGKTMAQDNVSSTNPSIQEMLAAIRSAMAKKETDFKTVLGEIGITEDQAVEMLVGEKLRKAQKAAEFGSKLVEALDLSADVEVDKALKLAGEMAGVWNGLGFDENKPDKPVETVGEMVKTQTEAAKAAREKLIDDTVKEKVSGEQAQALVRRMLQVPEGADKDKIVGEINALMEDRTLKAVLGKSFVDKPAGTGGKGDDSGPKYLKTKSVPV